MGSPLGIDQINSGLLLHSSIPVDNANVLCPSKKISEKGFE